MTKMPLHILSNITLERYVESRSLMMRGDPSTIPILKLFLFFVQIHAKFQLVGMMDP